MAINFNCSSCGKAIAVPEKMAGRTGKCPACGTRLTVPGKKAGGPAGTAVRKKKTATAAAIPVDQDGVDTVIDGMPSGLQDEGFAVPVPVDDDEFDVPMPEPVDDVPDVVDDDLPEPEDVDDDLPEPDDVDDDVPSAADVVARARAGRGTGSVGGRRAGRGGDEGGPKTRAQRMAEMKAGKKKGGFIWFLFGLILAIAHTAGAAILGAMIVLGYAHGEKQYEFMEQPAQILGLDAKIRDLKGGGTAADAHGDETDADHEHDHDNE